MAYMPGKCITADLEICRPSTCFVRLPIPLEYRTAPRLTAEDQKKSLEKGGFGEDTGQPRAFIILPNSIDSAAQTLAMFQDTRTSSWTTKCLLTRASEVMIQVDCSMRAELSFAWPFCTITARYVLPCSRLPFQKTEVVTPIVNVVH